MGLLIAVILRDKSIDVAANAQRQAEQGKPNDRSRKSG